VTEPQFKQISIIGVGLLGGSLGMAALQHKLTQKVVGIGRTQTGLQEAIRQGAISTGTTDLREGVEEADLIVLCTPVRNIADVLPEVVASAPDGAVISDVGSTKASIVAQGDEVTRGTGKFFVGCHPMAGSEKSGVRYSRPNLFEDSTCFVTRSTETDSRAFSMVCSLWRGLGSRIVISRPERHDTLTAMVSHLPHLAAVALVRAVENFNEDKNLIRGIIGNGFRDTTRIAAGNSDMWQDICMDNRAEIGIARDALEKSLNEIMQACQPGLECDKLKNILEAAREFREFLGLRKD
jgi:prephenate dehydrogenase